jgi:hypothetical protein
MAGIVESGLEDLSRPLSPTEGKFRVKGLKSWANGLRGYFWTGTGGNAMKPGIFTLWTRSSAFANFFTWQTGYDYRQYIFIKAPFFR